MSLTLVATACFKKAALWGTVPAVGAYTYFANIKTDMIDPLVDVGVLGVVVIAEAYAIYNLWKANQAILKAQAKEAEDREKRYAEESAKREAIYRQEAEQREQRLVTALERATNKLIP